MWLGNHLLVRQRGGAKKGGLSRYQGAFSRPSVHSFIFAFHIHRFKCFKCVFSHLTNHKSLHVDLQTASLVKQPLCIGGSIHLAFGSFWDSSNGGRGQRHHWLRHLSIKVIQVWWRGPSANQAGCFQPILCLLTSLHNVARFGGFLPNMSVIVLLTMMSC